jgi:hypothetical protein
MSYTPPVNPFTTTLVSGYSPPTSPLSVVLNTFEDDIATLTFPNLPALGDTHFSGTRIWVFDGIAWTRGTPISHARRPLTFSVASAARVLGATANTTGNTTVGIVVAFTEVVRVKGIAFVWNGTSAPVKGTIWLTGTGTIKATGTLTTGAGGYCELLFTTPYDVPATDLYKLHTLGIWDTTGAYYMRGLSSLTAPGLTFPVALERSCYQTDSAVSVSGDAMPATHNSTPYGYAVEPILAEV